MLLETLRDEKRMNPECIIRGAKWNAEIVRRLGREWFKMRGRPIRGYGVTRELEKALTRLCKN